MDNDQQRDARQRIAEQAYRFTDDEVRPFLENVGRLRSTGSQGYPRRLRQKLRDLDQARYVTFATRDAMGLAPSERVVEHVVPIKRIVIEIVDPRQADPRSNRSLEPIGGGPANSPDDVIAVFDRLLIKCWVTSDEHDRLNRAGKSYQWDAPDDDGRARYREAGVVAHPLAAVGQWQGRPDLTS